MNTFFLKTGLSASDSLRIMNKVVCLNGTDRYVEYSQSGDDNASGLILNGKVEGGVIGIKV